IPAPPSNIGGCSAIALCTSFINLVAERMFSAKVMEIIIKSGSSLFAKEMTEVEGTEGAILKTEYPLLIRTDSIIMQPKLCNSPSGVHNKILLTSVDGCLRVETFSFINLT